MLKNAMKFLIVPGFALILATGCGGDVSSTGRLNLAVTDAPVDDAVEVVITFVSATLQGLDGSSDQGPVVIPENDQMVDLMDYQGTDHAVLVSGLELPTGNYKVRLDADLTFTDIEQKSWIAFEEESPECLEATEGVVWAGTGDDMTCRYPLVIPSEEDSGFKPKGDVTIMADGTSSFTVEFDLRKNLVEPMDEEIFYKLKPTGVRLVDDTSSGTIEGAVDSGFLDTECGSAQAYIYLFDRTDSVDEFVPDDIHEGNTSCITSVPVIEETVEDVTSHRYLIGFVPAGVYGVAMTCEVDDPGVDDDLYFAVQTDGVNVNAGETTIQNIPPGE